ncbi:LAME_0G12838g1_1 [Lachancea meyersii CBS 8951]|uniref:LAME_0G12838g1_1 n=1 Tax=Lachancea meyersii CBS 8951 TaxID=1266667 RepID=A0A1G4K9V1_9SACH|nr:LAME_0G12838g1_1 [Lachancea meyersii CBS 8951]
MGRKPKGKSSSKGLKGALLRHQATEQAQKKVKTKQEHALQKNKPTKASLEQRASQREAAEKMIPFDKNSTLLLVGEGDLSFARSIIMQEYVKPENLLVTSFDNSPSELKLKYPKSFEANYDFLLENGVKVFFRIDATNLIKAFKISKKTTWSKIAGSEWAIKPVEFILFNFPHTGKGVKDQDKNIRDHQELILGFLESCKQFFKTANQVPTSRSAMGFAQGYTLDDDATNTRLSAEGCGKVLISVFTGEPYDSWQIKILARTTGWKVERSSKFNWANYPEYSHRRTNSEQDTTKPAAEREARTYMFEIFDKHAKTARKQKNSDSDDE